MDVIAWGPVLQQGGLLAIVIALIAAFVGVWKALRSRHVVMGWQYDEKAAEAVWWRGVAIELLNLNSASVTSTRILAEQQAGDTGTTGPEARRGMD